MPSPVAVDIDNLLEPVSPENPVGVDARLDHSPGSLYSRLRDARKAARAAERSSVFDGTSAEADEHWRTILEHAPEALRTQTKDLEVACWYTEALVRRAGFQGLRVGFALIRGLIENFWAEIYPLPDEDGVATRVAALTGLNGEGAEGVLIAPMRSVPITQGAQAFSYWQYKQALDAQRVTDDATRAELIAKNGFAVDDIQEAVDQSSEAFYVALCDDLRAAIEDYKRIGGLLDEHCGVHDSPPTSNIVNTLGDILGAVSHMARLKLPAPVQAPPPEEDASVPVPSAHAGGTSGPVTSREEAFRQLTQIAAYFRRTEPHSPVSYVIDKAVKWGGMSLAELVQELIPDSASRSTYSSLTGVSAEDGRE